MPGGEEGRKEGGEKKAEKKKNQNTPGLGSDLYWVTPSMLSSVVYNSPLTSIYFILALIN